MFEQDDIMRVMKEMVNTIAMKLRTIYQLSEFKRKQLSIIITGMALLLTGCGGNEVQEEQNMYQKISMTEAKEMMQKETDYILLDVRTEVEYKEGHIPGAICVPNETIGDGDIPELPDKGQVILVYCRSGNRSKQAAGKLAKLGYTNVIEFGGIIDWDGEIEK